MKPLIKSILIVSISLILGSMFLTSNEPPDIQSSPHIDLPVVNREMVQLIRTHSSMIRLHGSMGFFCTGVVIDDNYAMTAAHCISENGIIDEQNIQIYNSKSEHVTTAVPAILDNNRDIGLIKGNFTDFTKVKVDYYGRNVIEGMEVLACGFPSGQYEIYCSKLKLKGNKYFQYRASGLPIYKGMSGGPVFDTVSGELVGVNSAVNWYEIIVSPVIGVLEVFNL